MSTVTTLTQSIADISAWFEKYYGDIETFGRDLSALVEFDTAHPGALTEKSSNLIEQRSVRFLDEHELPDGAGAVFARSVMGSSDGLLEWWVRDPEQRVARYSFGINPTGDRFYDYERLEWFETAFGSQKRAIAGPYIDYLGVEEYIVTCTAPLEAGGRLVGVVGTDNRMADIEKALLPLLRRVQGDAAILNPHKNVLVGNSGRFVSGDRVSTAPEGFTITPLTVNSIELSLLHPSNA